MNVAQAVKYFDVSAHLSHKQNETKTGQMRHNLQTIPNRYKQTRNTKGNKMLRLTFYSCMKSLHIQLLMLMHYVVGESPSDIKLYLCLMFMRCLMRNMIDLAIC